MVKNTRKNIDNKFADIFNKLTYFLDQDYSVQSLAEFLESINSREVFNINRHIFLKRDDELSLDDLLSDDNWFDFLKFIKDGVGNSEINKENDTNSFEKKFKNLSVSCEHNDWNLSYINNHLEIFSGLLLSFNLDENDFSMTRSKELDYLIDNQEFYYKFDADNVVEINSLTLFNFGDLYSIESISLNLDNRVVRAYLKYVSEVISVEEFASEIIKEINSYLDKIKQDVVDKMLSLTIPRFDIHPVTLYSEDELEQFFIKEKNNFKYFIQSGFFERVLSEQDGCGYFYKFLKSKLTVENLSDELLLEAVSVENGSVFIEGFSNLTKDERMNYIFNLLEEYNPKDIKSYNHHILQNVYNGEVFCFLKETYKYYLNKLISGEKIEKEECLGLVMTSFEKKKFVLFKEDIFCKPYIKLSEDQISELKSELIPLLELIQDKVCISLGIRYRYDSFDPDDGMKNLSTHLGLYNHSLLYQLFNFIDWYPKKINFLEKVGDERDFVYYLECYSFLKIIENNPDFDCNLILKFEDSATWSSENKDKISLLINNIIGNKVTVLFDGKNSDQLITAEKFSSYNELKHFYDLTRV